MKIAAYITEITFIFLVPVFILMLRNTKLVRFVGPIVICYAVGMTIGLLPIPLDKELSLSITELVIPVAIPLILFSANLKETKILAKKVIFSFLLLIISVVCISTILNYTFAKYNAYNSILAAMSMGLYTGGTPNLFSIGKALGANENLLFISNAADSIIGGAFYLFLITLAKPLFHKILGNNKNIAYKIGDKEIEPPTQEGINMVLPKGRKNIFTLILSVLLSVFIVGIGIALAYLFTGKLNVAIIMLTITTLGIACSFIKKIRNIKGTYFVGEYFILVFSIALIMSIDISAISGMFWNVLLFFGLATVFSALLHLLLSRIFKINEDITIITMTAGIYGPAFIAPVATAIKNEKLTVAGLICGILGYAIGTYLGLLAALIFM